MAWVIPSKVPVVVAQDADVPFVVRYFPECPVWLGNSSPAAEAQSKLPEPSVVRNWLGEPSAVGGIHPTVLDPRILKSVTGEAPRVTQAPSASFRIFNTFKVVSNQSWPAEVEVGSEVPV
jgi:hypothetical protein